MADLEMDAIEIHHTPMPLQRTFAPSCKLLGQALIQPTDGTGTGSDSQQLLRDFSHSMSTRPRDKHLGQAFGNLWLVTAGLLKGLRVKCSSAISRHGEVFDRSSWPHQVTRIEPIAIAFALRCSFSPGRSKEVAQFFAHDFFHHHSGGITNFCA